MKLKEWEKHYDEKIENQIEEYLNEKGDELVVPNPLRTKEQQIATYRHDLKELLNSKSAEELTAKALTTICNLMRQVVSKEVWESLSDQFSHCEENLLRYLQEDEKKDTAIIPIYQMCGLSSETLMHCYTFGQSLFNQKEYADSKVIMLFLAYISPQIPEFWIAAAMCDKQMEQYQSAINIYTLAETTFSENPSLYLYCADAYLCLNDSYNAKIQLESAKRLFDRFPDEWTKWEKTYTYLLGKI